MGDEIRFGSERHPRHRQPRWSRGLGLLALAALALGYLAWHGGTRGSSTPPGRGGVVALAAGATPSGLPPSIQVVFAGHTVGPLTRDGRPGQPWLGPFGPDTWPVGLSALPGGVLVTEAILPFGTTETFDVQARSGRPILLAGTNGAFVVLPAGASAVYAAFSNPGQRAPVRVIGCSLTGRPRCRRFVSLSHGSVPVASTVAGLLVAQALSSHPPAYALTLLDPDTGRAAWLLPDAAGLPAAVSVNRIAIPTGRCPGTGCRLTVISLSTGARREYPVPAGLTPCCGAFSPGGQMLAVGYQAPASARTGGPVSVVNLATGAITSLTGLDTPPFGTPQLAWSADGSWLVAAVPVSISGSRELVLWRTGATRLTLAGRGLRPGLLAIPAAGGQARRQPGLP